jgi:hypothetical protein
MSKWIASIVLLSAVLLACPKKEPAAPTATTATTPAPPPTSAPATGTAPAAAAPAGIASADGETNGVKVVVQELKRTNGGTVSMKFSITNGSDKRVNNGYEFADKDHEALDYNSVGGVQLIDEGGRKKYFVIRAGGKCVCSQGIKEVKPGETENFWARFPAPPDTVQKITVVIPHFQPMDDVPIGK